MADNQSPVLQMRGDLSRAKCRAASSLPELGRSWGEAGAKLPRRPSRSRAADTVPQRRGFPRSHAVPRPCAFLPLRLPFKRKRTAGHCAPPCPRPAEAAPGFPHHSPHPGRRRPHPGRRAVPSAHAFPFFPASRARASPSSHPLPLPAPLFPFSHPLPLPAR